LWYFDYKNVIKICDQCESETELKCKKDQDFKLNFLACHRPLIYVDPLWSYGSADPYQNVTGYRSEILKNRNIYEVHPKSK
jgi:hypothetical protein